MLRILGPYKCNVTWYYAITLPISYKRGITLESHLWLLSKLLVKPEDPKVTNKIFTQNLLKYVIATCNPKILHRLSLSIPCYNSLSRVAPESITFKKYPTGSWNNTNNKALLSTITFIQSKLGLSLPKLAEQAVLSQKGEEYTLYTEETYLEFHHLLCALLKAFMGALKALEKCHNLQLKSPSQGPTNNKKSGDSKPCTQPTQFSIYIKTVLSHGYTLLWLLDCSVIDSHLQNIQSSLQDLRQTEAEPVLLSVEEDDTECGEEIMLPTLKHIWESYKGWLQLILTHFSVAERLIKYVTGPHFHYKEIAIKLLVTPYPSSSDSLPSVRNLLCDQGVLAGKDKNDQKANQDIMSFLDRSTPPLKATKALDKLVHTFKELQDTITPSLYETLVTQAISHVNILVECDLQLPDWGKCIDEIIQSLQALWESHDKATNLTCINNALCLLQYNIWIFQLLTSNTPKHAGTLHCKASIASFFALLLCELSGPYDDIVEELKVNLDCSHTSC